MSYRINTTREALREIKGLSGYVRAQARKLIRGLESDPRPPRAKELRGKPNVYRIWLAGRWRIAFEVDDESRRVEILRVRRKELMDYESLVGSSYVHEPQAEYDGEQTRRAGRRGQGPRQDGHMGPPLHRRTRRHQGYRGRPRVGLQEGDRGLGQGRSGDSPERPDVLTWLPSLLSRPFL